MPRPKQRRIKAREIYLKPKVVPAEVVRKRKLHRGEVARQHIPRMKPIAELKIEFLPDGRVVAPRYREIELGKIEPVKAATYKNPYDAIRATSHIIENVGSEFERLKVAQQQLAAVHAVLYDKWKQMNSEQREAAKRFLFSLIDLIQPRRRGYENIDLENANKIKRVPIKAPAKISAVKRLEKAIEYMERNNIGATRALIAGVSNDLIARMNTLLRQKAFLRRRRWALIKEKVVEETQVFSVYDALRRAREMLTRPETPRRIIIERLQNVINSITALQERYSRFERATRHLVKAIALIRARGSEVEIKRALGNAARTIYLVGSECTIFSRERLTELKEKGGEKTKITVARNQLALFADNAKYWFERARPEQKKNMYAFLRELRLLITGTRAQPAVVEIARAERALRGANAKECEEILLRAVEKIDAMLKKGEGRKKE
ncbi:MAG: hypothetical protein DRO07_00085 [Candidatus Iainarchaeum archaeon]|uniref:Uncharacterized protein n=1 Tax=Candidatus Iainarchaeum sp. TaxID=3101447 RepID=A0A497JHI2_9ARCH|nr:MAG: hypothetical protein DRO07_00085 [Candidatus Diapherotrites archaeon]